MNNMIQTLRNLKVQPKSRKEKILNWLGTHDGVCLSAILITAAGFLSYLIPHLIRRETISGFAILGTQFWIMSTIALTSMINKNDQVQKQHYKNEVLNYLKTHSDEPEAKELILKIKWIILYNELNMYNAKSYLKFLEQETISEDDIENAQIIMTLKLDVFMSTYQELLNQSSDELKLRLTKKIVSQLKQEKDNLQQYDALIEQYSDKQDNLFKKDKALKANL